MTVTFIVPTVGRASLARTLASIEAWPGDEIIVVGASMHPSVVDPRVRHLPHPPGKDWGSTERNHAMLLSRGQYLSFMDDDDWYAPGIRPVMDSAMRETPGKPLIFRMRFPDGTTIWYPEDREIRCGNVGTPMPVVPNVPSKLGAWGNDWGGDFRFMESWRWKSEDISWRPELIAHLGHNTDTRGEDHQ